MKFFTFAVFQVFASSAQAQTDGTMTLDVKDTGGGGRAIAVAARAGACLSTGGADVLLHSRHH